MENEIEKLFEKPNTFYPIVFHLIPGLLHAIETEYGKYTEKENGTTDKEIPSSS